MESGPSQKKMEQLRILMTSTLPENEMAHPLVSIKIAIFHLFKSMFVLSKLSSLSTWSFLKLFLVMTHQFGEKMEPLMKALFILLIGMT